MPTDGSQRLENRMMREGEAAPLLDPVRLRIPPEVVSIAVKLQVLVSVSICIAFIGAFGFQFSLVHGFSMAPTLDDRDRLIVDRLVYELGTPRPGDIVTLYYPVDPDKVFVKRVIAQEGDSVRIVGGRVYVNDVPLREDYVDARFRSYEDWGPEVVSDGYYFVLGDHRNGSMDSRDWGLVPKRYIIGKVKIRWWPLGHVAVF